MPDFSAMLDVTHPRAAGARPSNLPSRPNRPNRSNSARASHRRTLAAVGAAAITGLALSACGMTDMPTPRRTVTVTVDAPGARLDGADLGADGVDDPDDAA